MNKVIFAGVLLMALATVCVADPKLPKRPGVAIAGGVRG